MPRISGWQGGGVSLHSSSGRWRLGLGLSLLTVLLWGMLPIALSVTLQVLDVYTVTWFRFLVSFVLLAGYLAARGQLPPWSKLRLMPLKLLAIATVCLAINYLLFLQGLAQTSPATAQVLIQLAPVCMSLGAIAVFKERYTLWQWLGLGLLSFGLMLFFQDQLRAMVTTVNQYLVGSSLLVVAAVAWAVYALAQKQLLYRLPS
ncbi:MAG TPA: DMT family transporter, partial [Candidatus Caenarcaniphilales bacterium]